MNIIDRQSLALQLYNEVANFPDPKDKFSREAPYALLALLCEIKSLTEKDLSEYSFSTTLDSIQMKAEDLKKYSPNWEDNLKHIQKIATSII